MRTTLVILAAAAMVVSMPSARADGDAGEQRFRDLYKELIETNTTLSAGSCTLAAERMAAHLKAAGLADSDLHPFAVPDHPLTEAKLELIQARGGDAFTEYSLPEAILKFRQGVGRLIRSKTDKGIIVLLDSRVKTKFYGKLFLQALPDCKLVDVT